ncbi:type IV secretion protein Rhs [Rhodococcus sp. WMMA185]|nr:type IV secretion protein Rhs [Rhodococcus sp. WMMA185]
MARGTGRDGNNPNADLPGDDAPVDVAAVRRDDAFIDAIAADGPVSTDSPEQYELALLLADWRADIGATPMPTDPSLDDVIAAVEASEARSARSAALGRLRLLRPLAAAAAGIAVVMGGATIFSYNAEPGDPLWSVKSVVFSQQADSTVARIDTTSQLEQAERMIAEGDAPRARDMLATAADRAGAVREPDVRSELEGWRSKLAAEVEEIAPTTPEATPPPATTTTNEPTATTEPPSSVTGTPESTVPTTDASPTSAAPTAGPGEPASSPGQSPSPTMSPTTTPDSTIVTVTPSPSPSPSPTEETSIEPPVRQPSNGTSSVEPTTAPTTVPFTGSG